MSSVKDCVFDANLIQSDVLDMYNSSNRVIERCRFKGADSTNYVTIKSLFNHDPNGLNTGIDSDQIGAQSNIVISNSLFEGKVSRDYGAIAIYTSNRTNDTLSVPDQYKRYNVKVDKCTFKLSGMTSPDYNAAIALGKARFVSVTNNTVVISGVERSVLVNCIHRVSTDIIISGNVLKNEVETSNVTSKLIGKTFGKGRLAHSIIDNNIVQIGYILNDKIAWDSLTITNNSSLNVINTGSDELMRNCYRAGNKNGGAFSDNYGAARPAAQTVPPGFSYFDTGLGKILWTRLRIVAPKVNEWVDINGAVIL
jgi:hypothetical protein